MNPATTALTLTLLAAPALAQSGDTCSTAIPVNAPGTHVVELATATRSLFSNGSASLSCLIARPGFCQDRFYQFTAPAAGSYEFVVAGGDISTLAMVLHTGFGCASECTEVASSSGIQLHGVSAGAQFLIQCGRQTIPPFGGCTDTPMLLEIDQCLGTRQDAYEDNDTCATAAPIQDGNIAGLNVERMDRDHYSIDLPADMVLNANLSFSHGDADVDLYLWDAALGCGGSDLARSVSSTDNESLTYTNTSGATRSLVLEVRVAAGSAGACASYSLGVARSSTFGPIGGTYCAAVPNATGLPCYLTGHGSSSIALNTITVIALDLPVNQFGLLAVSDTQAFVPGLNGTSNGDLCLGGVLGRYPVTTTGPHGISAMAIDLAAIPQGGGLMTVAPGMTLNFQYWYRDPIGRGSNLSGGMAIDLVP